MRRFFISLILMVMGAASLSAQFMVSSASYNDLDDSETVSAFKSHIEYIASPSMAGRAAGSEGELETARYITEMFKEYGVDVLSGSDGELFGLKQENGDTLTSRNVIGFIRGYDHSLKDKYILIGARMDNIGKMTVMVNGEPVEKVYYGANGNASGIAMMLELARMLKTNSIMLRRSVLFVGFGASQQSYAGAWYFLNRSFPDVENIQAMIDLDSVGEGGAGFYGYSFSNQDMNAIATKLSGTLQPIQPTITSAEPLGSDGHAFYSKQIPSMLFTTGPYPERGTDRDVPSVIDYETMESELEYIYNYTYDLINSDNAPVFNPSDELKKSASSDKAVPYYDCDWKPTFLGSNDPKVFLQKWVYQYLKYPKAAVEQGIQGRVLVDFTINEKGKVGDVHVAKGVNPLLDDEAVRVISASPDWKPGRVNGKKVKAKISLYVEFRLEKKK